MYKTKHFFLNVRNICELYECSQIPTGIEIIKYNSSKKVWVGKIHDIYLPKIKHTAREQTGIKKLFTKYTECVHKSWHLGTQAYAFQSKTKTDKAVGQVCNFVCNWKVETVTLSKPPTSPAEINHPHPHHRQPFSMTPTVFVWGYVGPFPLSAVRSAGPGPWNELPWKNFTVLPCERAPD